MAANNYTSIAAVTLTNPSNVPAFRFFWMLFQNCQFTKSFSGHIYCCTFHCIHLSLKSNLFSTCLFLSKLFIRSNPNHILCNHIDRQTNIYHRSRIRCSLVHLFYIVKHCFQRMLQAEYHFGSV